MSKNNIVEISKTISHALRHQPEVYGLELDSQGWVNIDKLIDSIQQKLGSSYEVNKDVIQKILDSSSKKRFEIKDEKIRAYYGHSVDEKIEYEEAEPPEFLFHGTTKETSSNILKEGIKPMSRQYVHLSKDEKTAKTVGGRKTGNVVILKVKSYKAYKNGVKFFNPSDNVWLCNRVDPNFVVLLRDKLD